MLYHQPHACLLSMAKELHVNGSSPLTPGWGGVSRGSGFPAGSLPVSPSPSQPPPPPFMASLTGAKTVCLLPGTALNSTPLQAQHPAALLAPTGRIYFCLAFILATNNGSRSQHPISPSLPRPPASTWRRRKGGRGWGGSRRQSCVCGAESSAVISWCCWLGNCTSCTSPLGLSSGL